MLKILINLKNNLTINTQIKGFSNPIILMNFDYKKINIGLKPWSNFIFFTKFPYFILKITVDS